MNQFSWNKKIRVDANMLLIQFNFHRNSIHVKANLFKAKIYLRFK